jgi:hypothetical protein
LSTTGDLRPAAISRPHSSYRVQLASVYKPILYRLSFGFYSNWLSNLLKDNIQDAYHSQRVSLSRKPNSSSILLNGTLDRSCHCKAIEFELESNTPAPYQLCQCSICRKTGGYMGSVNISEYRLSPGSLFSSLKIGESSGQHRYTQDHERRRQDEVRDTTVKRALQSCSLSTISGHTRPSNMRTANNLDNAARPVNSAANAPPCCGSLTSSGLT